MSWRASIPLDNGSTRSAHYSLFLSLSKHVQTGCKRRAKYASKSSEVCFSEKIRHALQSAPAGRECSVTRPTHTTADTLHLMEGAADEGCRDKVGCHNDRLLFSFFPFIFFCWDDKTLLTLFVSASYWICGGRLKYSILPAFRRIHLNRVGTHQTAWKKNKKLPKLKAQAGSFVPRHLGHNDVHYSSLSVHKSPPSSCFPFLFLLWIAFAHEISFFVCLDRQASKVCWFYFWTRVCVCVCKS